MSRRPPGAGTIEPRRNGTFRARILLSDGRREPLGTFKTFDEAQRVLDAATMDLADRKMAPVGGVTFLGYATGWFDRREARKEVRDIENQRRNFNLHLAGADFADRPLVTLTRADVRAWLDAMLRKRAKGTKRPISRATVHRNLALLKVILRDAADDEIVPANVAKDVKIRGREGQTHEPWAYLTLAEQQAIATCDAIPEPDRLIMAFAWYTGLRASELAALRLADVHLDGDAPHVVVRFSKGDKAPKSGKIRRVPLLPAAVPVVRRWLEVLRTYASENEKRLAFPTPSGARRQAGKLLGCDLEPVPTKDGTKKWRKVDRFARYLAAAGITRKVRWHDLRHTCGSSLVSGAWGRRWSLEEVREVLGHSTITMTQRYAHLGTSAIAAAAQATVEAASERSGRASAGGFAKPPRSPQARRGRSRNPLFCRVGRDGLEPSTNGLKVRSSTD